MRSASATLAAPVLVVLLGGLLAGCSGDDEPPLPPRTPLPTERADPLWNPCDALEPLEVADLFGTTFEQQTGTEQEPRCTFTPTVEGDVVIDVNYELYGGTLEDVVSQLGDPQGSSELLEPRVPGASEARVVIDSDADALAVTGLVRNGRLVQVVNTLDLTPYDRDSTVEGVRELMADLAANAEQSGLNVEE